MEKSQTTSESSKSEQEKLISSLNSSEAQTPQNEPKEVPFQYKINNYVYKKIFEEWIETRIVQIHDSFVSIYVLKTHSLMNCHITDLFPSTVETMRKFKITPTKPKNFFNNPLLVSIITEKKEFDFTHDLDEILTDFTEFLVANKPTAYQDELQQFGIYIKSLVSKYGNTILFPNEIENIQEKETDKIRCHPIHIMRLCLFWHFVLKKNIEDEIVVETGYDFFIYFTDWIFLTFFSK